MKKIDFDGSNITFYKYHETKEVFPESVEDIKKALKLYDGIYPISTGFNWGLGSKIPVSENCVILNLSKMNSIVEYDEDAGVVIVEPGVTQFQLANFLIEKKSKYFLDVTGSSGDSSIIGNTIDRGIGYNRLRADLVTGIEGVTGNGDLIQTGSLRFENSSLKSIYSHGVGPNLTDIFFQSNYIVATKVALKLLKKKKINYSVQLSFKSTKLLLESLVAFKELLDLGVIDTIFHVANSSRAIGALLPYYQVLYSREKEGEAENILKRFIRGEWNSAGIISGYNRKDTKNKIKVFKSIMSPYASVRIVDVDKVNLLQKLLNFYPNFTLTKFLNSTAPFRNLYFGIPTNAALGIVLKNEEMKPASVDNSKVGFLYCLPLTRLEERTCRKMLDIISNVAIKYNFTPAITLNIISSAIIEAVVSINFIPEQARTAQRCIREMQLELMQDGHYPYRTNIKDMDLYFKDSEYNNYIEGLKKVFDPEEKISPGRYLVKAS